MSSLFLIMFKRKEGKKLKEMSFSNTEPSPRVNAQQASMNIGRRVLLVGRVLQGGDKLQCADDSIVSVRFYSNPQQQGSEMSGPLAEGKVVEIAGVMDSQDVIREETRTYFEGSFGTLRSI